MLSTTAKHTVLGVSAIEDIRKNFCSTEIGGARLGDTPQLDPPNFWTSKSLQLDGSNFRNG